MSEWVAREGSGAISRLSRETGLAYTTVFEAAHGRRAVRYETAKRISEATDGVVTIEEICEPAD